MDDWIGEEWEAYCLQLIRWEYGVENVQEVPARHGGDLGIEAFTRNGVAIQCYASRSAIGVKQRYEHQRNKLTEDLAKLERYQGDLIRTLGGIRIRSYLYMVPLLDSRQIVQHAAAKSEEYRAKGLPHLHEDFRIVVVTDDAFPDAQMAVRRQRSNLESLKRTGAILSGRLSEYDPVRDMGIHPPLRSQSSAALPDYVHRTIDTELDNAISRGGLVVLEGNSAAGKSRTGYEALKRGEERLRWRSIIVPRDGSSLRAFVEASDNIRNMAIWLDDLERFMTADGLDESLISSLCPQGRSDIVLLATLRTQAKYALMGRDGQMMAGASRALSSAKTIYVDRHLNDKEREYALSLQGDLRIAEALANPEQCGLAEYLAAAPAVVDRWRDAINGANELAGAIISAAVDIRIAGYTTPIPRTWLEAGYAIYLDKRMRRDVNSAELNEAFLWASQRVHGASSCITPRNNETYSVFEYLLELRGSLQSAESDQKDVFKAIKAIPHDLWHGVFENLSFDDPNFLGCASVAWAAGHPWLLTLLQHRFSHGDFGIEDVQENQVISLVRACATINLCVACMAETLEIDLDILLPRLMLPLRLGQRSDDEPIDSRSEDALFALNQFGCDGRPDHDGTRVGVTADSIAVDQICELGILLSSVGYDVGGYIWLRNAAQRGSSKAAELLQTLPVPESILAEAEAEAEGTGNGRSSMDG
jgi:hypothetical protein